MDEPLGWDLEEETKPWGLSQAGSSLVLPFIDS